VHQSVLKVKVMHGKNMDKFTNTHKATPILPKNWISVSDYLHEVGQNAFRCASTVLHA
jgi:hypothetical protein